MREAAQEEATILRQARSIAENESKLEIAARKSKRAARKELQHALAGDSESDESDLSSSTVSSSDSDKEELDANLLGEGEGDAALDQISARMDHLWRRWMKDDVLAHGNAKQPPVTVMPRHSRARTWILRALAREAEANGWKEAIFAANQAVQQEPRSAIARAFRAAILLRAKKFEGARKDLEWCLKRRRDYNLAQQRRVARRLARGDRNVHRSSTGDESAKDAAAGLSGLHMMPLLYNMALVFVSTGKHVEAMKKLNEALKTHDQRWAELKGRIEFLSDPSLLAAGGRPSGSTMATQRAMLTRDGSTRGGSRGGKRSTGRETGTPGATANDRATTGLGETEPDRTRRSSRSRSPTSSRRRTSATGGNNSDRSPIKSGRSIQSTARSGRSQAPLAAVRAAADAEKLKQADHAAEEQALEHANMVGPASIATRLRNLQKHHDPDVLRLRSLLLRRNGDFMKAQEDAAAAIHYERAIARASAELRSAKQAVKQEKQLIADSLFQESMESLRSVSLLDAGAKLAGEIGTSAIEAAGAPGAPNIGGSASGFGRLSGMSVSSTTSAFAEEEELGSLLIAPHGGLRASRSVSSVIAARAARRRTTWRNGGHTSSMSSLPGAGMSSATSGMERSSRASLRADSAASGMSGVALAQSDFATTGSMSILAYDAAKDDSGPGTQKMIVDVPSLRGGTPGGLAGVQAAASVAQLLDEGPELPKSAEMEPASAAVMDALRFGHDGTVALLAAHAAALPEVSSHVASRGMLAQDTLLNPWRLTVAPTSVRAQESRVLEDLDLQAIMGIKLTQDSSAEGVARGEALRQAASRSLKLTGGSVASTTSRRRRHGRRRRGSLATMDNVSGTGSVVELLPPPAAPYEQVISGTLDAFSAILGAPTGAQEALATKPTRRGPAAVSAILSLLDPMPVVRRLSMEARTALARCVRYRRVADGELACREGQRPRGLLIVMSGALRVTIRVPQMAVPVTVDTLDPGDTYGELPLLQGEAGRCLGVVGGAGGAVHEHSGGLQTGRGGGGEPGLHRARGGAEILFVEA